MSSRRLLASIAASLLTAGAHGAGTLTVCTEAAPDGFDIAQSESAVTHDAVGKTVHDQLVHFKRGTTELVPGLAERWEVSADGLQVTLHLPRGVKFHSTPWFTPTREMNADDVLFSLQRQADPKSPWLRVAKTGFGMWHGTGLAEVVKAIDKVDAMTVRLTLRHPSAPLMTYLATPFTGSVYSAEYGEQLLKAGKPEQINVLPVGTGPFVFKSYQKDAVIRFSAHPSYWDGRQPIDNLIIAITPDAQVRVQRLKAGECLVGANMKAEAFSAFEGTPVRMVGGSTLLTGYAPLNTKKKFLNDKRFRQALWLALDKANYIKSVYGGRADAATSFLPPAQWGHDTTLADRRDVEQAKALVRAAGYDGTELVIFTRIGGSIDGRRAAEVMQADWARVGVKTRIQMMEWGELLKRTGQGEHDITFLGWAGSGDPNDFFAPNLACASVASGGNKSQWCDKAFDALTATGAATQERSQRSAIYGKAQRVLWDEVPLIPLVYPHYFTAVHQKVRGFITSPLTDLDFRNVSVQ
ncbi:ABC transporter substrate-binding protein [Ideonella sp. BN130291]|uniref:ABC transporter substrate-binding protein n=1 Tax=Ideonella sp. BN130291 TaxID=3112940 RepID=UPI002E267FDD|nr:ABC transporter substrate-binding protein [Ideonella sp. BN130291]